MKRIIFIFSLVIASLAANAQLTLSQKSTLAQSATFRDRLYQALMSKANVYISQTPTNLQWQKQVNYAKAFAKGISQIDVQVVARFWLANYNGVPVLDVNNQPTDNEILNSAGLDVVYNALAGINAGDQALPLAQ